jgi:hypothetical protein
MHSTRSDSIRLDSIRCSIRSLSATCGPAPAKGERDRCACSHPLPGPAKDQPRNAGALPLKFPLCSFQSAGGTTETTARGHFAASVSAIHSLAREPVRSPDTSASLSRNPSCVKAPKGAISIARSPETLGGGGATPSPGQHCPRRMEARRMEARRLELLTPSVQRKCSPN